MTTVETSAGIVEGTSRHEGCIEFLCVPYAASPREAGWFAAPAPHEPWDGVRPCVEYGATAPQPAQEVTIIPEPVMPGDNCLNLNVFTPDPARGVGLPVFFYVHGGGFAN